VGLFGCGLILAGVLLVQLVPLWPRKTPNANQLEPEASPPQDAP
jgi:hypothetical protein